MYDASGRLNFDIFDGANELYARETYSLSAGNWYHFVVVYDGSGTQEGVIFYINGTSIPATDGGLAGTLDYDGTTADLLLGHRIDNEYFDGFITCRFICNTAIIKDTTLSNFLQCAGSNSLKSINRLSNTKSLNSPFSCLPMF